MEASVPVASGPELAAANIANEPFFEDPVERAERDRRATRRLAMAMGLAILLHVLVTAVTVIAPDWWRHAEPPKAIPITLVAEPPPPPPPPPVPAEKPAPPPPPAPPAQPYAESGPDEKMASATTEPPQPVPSPTPPASEPAPETAPQPVTAPPKPAEPPAPQASVAAPEAPKPVPKPIPPPKPAAPKAPPKAKPGSPAKAAPPGERNMTGDVYLNAVRAKILRNYRYPDSFRRDGLAGSTVFLMALARNGEIVRLDVLNSSGSSAIDLYAEEVIRRSSPVPPVPPNIPGDPIPITIVMNIGPNT
jgi:TonB family protein